MPCIARYFPTSITVFALKILTLQQILAYFDYSIIFKLSYETYAMKYMRLIFCNAILTKLKFYLWKISLSRRYE